MGYLALLLLRDFSECLLAPIGIGQEEWVIAEPFGASLSVAYPAFHCALGIHPVTALVDEYQRADEARGTLFVGHPIQCREELGIVGGIICAFSGITG